MSDCETGTCSTCKNQAPLQRQYYYYSIDCQCCRGDKHFEIIRYCITCEPEPPDRITVSMYPDEIPKHCLELISIDPIFKKIKF